MFHHFHWKKGHWDWWWHILNTCKCWSFDSWWFSLQQVLIFRRYVSLRGCMWVRTRLETMSCCAETALKRRENPCLSSVRYQARKYLQTQARKTAPTPWKRRETKQKMKMQKPAVFNWLRLMFTSFAPYSDLLLTSFPRFLIFFAHLLSTLFSPYITSPLFSSFSHLIHTFFSSFSHLLLSLFSPYVHLILTSHHSHLIFTLFSPSSHRILTLCSPYSHLSFWDRRWNVDAFSFPAFWLYSYLILTLLWLYFLGLALNMQKPAESYRFCAYCFFLHLTSFSGTEHVHACNFPKKCTSIGDCCCKHVQDDLRRI